MLSGNQSFAWAMYEDEPSAAAAAKRLIEAGFATERIFALLLSSDGVKERPLRHKTGVGAGAVIGGVLGATAGALAWPGLGLIAVGGAVLEAATVGGTTGVIAGMAGGLGLWKDELDVPREAFERGAVLVGALVTPERADDAKAALAVAGGGEPQVTTQAVAEQRLREVGEHAHEP